MFKLLNIQDIQLIQMNIVGPRYKPFVNFSVFLLFSILSCISVFSQTKVTTFRGIVKDSVSQEVIPSVTISFDGTSTGVLSDENGEFSVNNWINKTEVVISILGYKTKRINIPEGRITTSEVLLQKDHLQLKEIVIKPQKEKYSKKNNPAVELIKQVIANKHINYITDKEYYNRKEYERILFALNDFKPDQPQFKKFKFLSNYIDTSLIDSKPILPFSVRETVRETFYRKEPKTQRVFVDGYKLSGIDRAIETEGLDAVIAEVFQNVNIYDNSIQLLLSDFISPLSDNGAVNFYRWYIQDTIMLDDQKKYIDLAFIPFNTRDIGFTGNLYITTDSTYAVKKAILRAPRRMNINFVDEMIIIHDFQQVAPRTWIPKEQHMAIDLSLYKAVKFYVDKEVRFNNYDFNQTNDSILNQPAPVLYAQKFEDRENDFWQRNRPEGNNFRMDSMVEAIRGVPVFNFMLNAANLVSSGYFHTNKNPYKNKLDLGTLLTLYSYNPVEGNRFRLTAVTTKNFNPNLFLYGYVAYGTKDNKMKYYGEVAWAFNKVKDHKDQFPKNNLILAYKYDVNSLGQRFTQAERDNILMSLRRSKNDKMTYSKQAEVTYDREYYNGISFKLSAQTFDERPAGSMLFEKINEKGDKYTVNKLNSSEFTTTVRFAPDEKFLQQRRKRYSIPSDNFKTSLTHTHAFKGVLDGQFNYDKLSFAIEKEFWLGPLGKLEMRANADKIWGETYFPLLLSPSANNSFTIQKNSFNLIEPLEFMHDAQVSWMVEYRMGGWIFNRIPFFNRLKLREVFGFKGFVGELSKRNNPLYNHDLLIFPESSFTANNGPYMEFNVGIENILTFFRIDYVRRLSYLDHQGIDKSGFRITFDMSF